MLWPNGAATPLAESEHMDIAGHPDAVLAPKGAERKYQAYDLLRSQAGFHRAAFTPVWNDVFDFAFS